VGPGPRPHAGGAGALSFALLLAACGGAAPETGQQPELIELRIGDAVVRVEIADTDATRSLGLMHRTELPENRGMLFVYPQSARLSFWMKNTLVPLDIAFIDRSGYIIDIQSMTPMSEESHRSPLPVPYALEVNRGWFERHGVRVYDRVDGLPGPG
jgi:uncharacterized membrane protein (UPF0127 family)